MSNDELYHYGTPRHSGRYPWGSGENPYQHERDFLAYVDHLSKQGVNEKDIATLCGMSTTELRKWKSVAKEQRKQDLQVQIEKGYSEGKSRTQIANELGIPESTIREWEKESSLAKQKAKSRTVDILKSSVDKSGYIDVGEGVESGLGVSSTNLKNAVTELKSQGYEEFSVRIPQATNPGKYTTVQVLAKPGTTFEDVVKNKEKIVIPGQTISSDPNKSKLGIRKPQEVSLDRVQVVYGEEGSKKDGLIELRRGVSDLDIGTANYAQVRIAVDGNRYMKGVAVYSDDLPDGIDIRFNSSKKSVEASFKGMKTKEDGTVDWDNPFGSSIKENGQRGALNIVNEAGDWQEWSKTLSSQFLSKQSVKLAKQQLGFAESERKEEFKEIMSLTNPTVRKQLLIEFADKCDTSAEHLKAAAMPGQSNSLILPVNSLKPNEIYAPNYKNGETVILIRHPHGGIFELPQLTVNNRNKEAQKMITPMSTDAVGIHYSVAQQLSGADFDGDTVIVIPNKSRQIKVDAARKELMAFNPREAYPKYPGMKVISEDDKQKKMGEVSNLITDMTIQNAPMEHIVRAVKHSMVIIDAEKHELNYRQSYKDQGIEELKRIYQQKPGTKKGYGGASTIVSRAKSEARVPHRKEWRLEGGQYDTVDGKKVFRPNTDPNTGEKVFFPDKKNATYVNKKGETVVRTDKSTQMRETKDARSLISASNTAMENEYARYANSMKAMANTARREALRVKEVPQTPEARKQYAAEYTSLRDKLTTAKAWSPKERNAQIYAAHVYSAKLRENPDMTDDTKKKIKQQALKTGRARLGGEKPKVTFTDREWEAIQKGAISKTMLKELLRYADSEEVKQRAMPKTSTKLSASKIAIAKARIQAGYSWDEVAKMMGVSKSTLQRAMKE